MSDMAFLVDTTKCIGCRACQVACKQWNSLPAEKAGLPEGVGYTNLSRLSSITFCHVKFFEVDRVNPEKPVWTMMHVKCYHCNQANCMAVCPERAISKVDGWTIIDQERCIGCHACEIECVYSVPHVNDFDNKAYKCYACHSSRVLPACVKTCPTGTLTYDYRLKVLIKANERLKEIKSDYPNASIYGLEQFGGLHQITVLKDTPDKYGLPLHPESKEMADFEVINNIYSLLSLCSFGLPPLKRLAYTISKSFASNGRKIS